MKITRTVNEIVDIINETLGMDICQADGNDIRIDTNKDAEGTSIYFHDYLFCTYDVLSNDIFYHYVNQQGMIDGRLNITLNIYAVDDDERYDDKCINREGAHDDDCNFSVNIDDTGVWTFDEDTFINVLEGLKTVLKVKTEQQLVILDDEEEFVV